MDGCGLNWIQNGWIWIEFETKWMKLDGNGWIWIELDTK
jgi:hypothetical protein